MKRRYEIRLSDKDAVLDKVIGENGAPQNAREMEIAILVNLFEIAAGEMKSKKEINAASDSARRVECLNDDEVLIIDDEDVAFIDKALAATAGKRPISWAKCRAMWKALDELEPIK